MFALLVVLCYSCEQTPPSGGSGTGTATVYTLSTSSWSLIIDGKDYGKIRKATQMPVCGDPIFQNIKLSAGTHSFDAKSLDGYAWGQPKNVNIPAGGCIQVSLP